MINVSISQLKTNPAKVIAQALDYPVAVQKRNRVQAYLVGSELYDKLVSFIEDFVDKQAVEKTDFSKGKDFEKVAEELGI